MKYKAIIFDMDGTITNTEPILLKASKQLITQRGIILTDDDERYFYQQLKGLALGASCQLIQQITQTDEHIDDLIQEKMKIINNLYEEGIQFIDGFPEFHTKVSSHSLPTAVATNAQMRTIELTNKALNLKEYFGPHIYSIAHVNNVRKPDPAVYLYAAQQLGIDPTECIAIEDSAPGIQAAKAAGMLCIGINTGKNLEHIKQADIKINEYKDLELETILY